MANGYSSYTPMDPNESISYASTSSNQPTTFVVRTNLYTPGGEFTLPDGKEYIGFYHIHPDKGPMVGANHVKEFHEILIPISGEEPPKISSIELINNYSYDDYSEKDLKLISPVTTSISEFRPAIDRVEFFIYNEQGLLDVINYNYEAYSILSGYNSATGVVSTIDIDPGSDLIREGYTQGFYQIVYNFLRDKINSNPDLQYYISQISADRTELRLASNILSNEQIADSTNTFIQELNSSPFFEDFYLNFGNNNLVTGLKIALDDEDNPDQFSVIVKLYEALPPQFTLKDSVWVSLQTAEAVSFDVEFAPKIFSPPPPKSIKGPNFDIVSKDITNNSTVFQNADDLTLLNTILTSSKDQLQNVLNQKGIKVSIDYEDYNNFIYFSSAQSRLENFYYKVKEIEDFKSELAVVNTLPVNTSTSSSRALLENKITNIIANFDGYENFLYYDSGSLKTWPKSNSTPPYNLHLTSSADVIAWYGSANELSPSGQLGSASLYDVDNTDNLVNSLPEYVKENIVNQPFFKFIDMVGQSFDIFWAYTKAIGDRYDADNRLDFGISKDIVADAIRSMGVTLYQNNFSSNDLSAAFLGINGSGSLLPPTGSEVINNYVSASTDLTKLDDVNKETYKRIFHNLPFLLKKKGTVSGLRTLINTYGIPDTILRISEFGGKDINNSNDWDYTQNVYSKAAFNSASSATSFISTSFQLNNNWNADDNVPSTIRFRFKPEVQFVTGNSQSIVAHTQNGSDEIQLLLSYPGSGLLSSSYSGSIPSSSNQIVSLSMGQAGIPFGPVITASFYDGNFWGVELTRISASRTFTLRAANNVYNGKDGFKIGYTASNSAVINTIRNNLFTGSTDFYLARKTAAITAEYKGMTGSFQELRFYNVATQSETTFHDFVMNPYSIEGIDYSSSAENLVFRAPLGSDLNVNTGILKSIHPKVTGSLTITHSFAANSNYEIGNNIVFINNTEFTYQDQPAVGLKNRINEKIRAVNSINADGNTLTPYRTIQQRYANSESYTRDVNHVEIAFSPQNEINDDINSSFGYFNIGDYIGDPGYVSESISSYKELGKLQDTYFEKYIGSYDLKDYIRLIKYFDNSLFKMLKDFVPSKTSLSTGVIIKPHILERNRQRPAYVTNEEHNKFTSSISISNSSSFVSGGTGGTFDSVNFSGSGETYQDYIQSKNGVITSSVTDQRQFYNGELPSSNFFKSESSQLIAITSEVGPLPPRASGSNDFWTGSSIPSGTFNPLLNNVEKGVTSSIYYRVEYNNSFIVPSNIDRIENTKGEKASVHDDFYQRNAWVLGRYKGTRVSSQDINKTFR